MFKFTVVIIVYLLKCADLLNNIYSSNLVATRLAPKLHFEDCNCGLNVLVDLNIFKARNLQVNKVVLGLKIMIAWVKFHSMSKV